MLAAIGMDLKSEKIKNSLIMLGIAGIMVKAAWFFGLSRMADCGMGFMIPIFSLFILFYFHMFGAGDIKLLAVTGGFLGVRGSIFCMLASFFIGAVFAAVKMLYYNSFHERFAYFFHYMKKILKNQKREPYYLDDQKAARLHFSIPIACSVALYYIGGGM